MAQVGNKTNVSEYGSARRNVRDLKLRHNQIPRYGGIVSDHPVSERLQTLQFEGQIDTIRIPSAHVGHLESDGAIAILSEYLRNGYIEVWCILAEDNHIISTFIVVNSNAPG